MVAQHRSPHLNHALRSSGRATQKADFAVTAPIVLQSAGLRVEFSRQGDRFAHRVLADEGGRWVVLLESIEGSPEDDWPPSPPWQEVHHQRRGDVQLALAVGRAGSSHWSASFELAASGTLLVDVACRAAAPPKQLGSRYRIRGPREPQSTPMRVMLARHWTLRPGGGELACGPHDDCGTSDEVSIYPVVGSEGDWPQTIRWTYTIESAIESHAP